MTNITISNLPVASSASTSNILPIVQGGVTMQVAFSGLPISTAQQTAFDLKAPIASPTFTGTVGGVTQAMVGLGSVNNTSDAGKPVSTAQQTALNLKANLAGPTFTGVPVAPTASVGTNTTQIATTAFVLANQSSYTLPAASGSVLGGVRVTTSTSAPTGGADGDIWLQV